MFSTSVKHGFLPAIDEFLSGVDQRFCVRHLYNNFMKKLPEKKLKELMWRATKSTYINVWERELKEIKATSEEAFNYLIQIRPRHWTKAMLADAKCDTLVNMSETFNYVIVIPRTKPFVTMLEDIRVCLMERWEMNRQNFFKYEYVVMPKIKKILENESSYTNN